MNLYNKTKIKYNYDVYSYSYNLIYLELNV